MSSVSEQSPRSKPDQRVQRPSECVPPITASKGEIRYVREVRPVFFPEEEKEPETGEHVELKLLLFEFLKFAFRDRATIGCDQFVYWDPTSPRSCLAPDAFVRLGQPHELVRSWKTWERGAPHVAVEVVSDFDARDRNWQANFEKYRRLGVYELVRFDPSCLEQPLRIWNLESNDLVVRDGIGRCVASAYLGGYWLVVPHPELGLSLRLSRDREGARLYLTPAEHEAEARRAEAEARRAEAGGRIRAEQRVRELEAELAALRASRAEQK